MEHGTLRPSKGTSDNAPGAMKRHRWVGGMNAFSCETVCGLPMDDSIHYTYDEVDMIEWAAIERGEASRWDSDDPEC